MKKTIIALCLLLICLAGCAHQMLVPHTTGLPGFWSGLWHGSILIFSFIGSFFSDCKIYAFPNTGHWYDFGYILGLNGVLWSIITLILRDDDD
jgi:hypothetical protein